MPSVPLCANIAETNSSSFIIVEGEEKMDVKRHGKYMVVRRLKFNEKPVRRRFTAEYKMRIIEEADGCTDKGQVGELLRREGLYSSHLVELAAAAQARLAGFAEAKATWPQTKTERQVHSENLGGCSARIGVSRNGCARPR